MLSNQATLLLMKLKIKVSLRAIEGSVAIFFNKFVIAMSTAKKQSHKNEFLIIFL